MTLSNSDDGLLQPVHHDFSNLDPETVIHLIEKTFNLKLTNLCRQLNSYINRVFELAAVDGEKYVVKFYRPGRWNKPAIEDEHGFLLELIEQEVPVIAPLKNKNGITLLEHQGIYFTLFAFRGGRNSDEFSPSQWQELGRLVGRVHLIGSVRKPVDRIILAPDISTEENAHFILDGGFLPSELEYEYEDLVFDLIDTICPMFQDREYIRIHGDMHPGNILYRPDTGFLLLDFDDMASGPAVQDFWMLLPGYHNQCANEIELFLAGYETFRPFDMGSLKLIEPLRFMRYLHFCAWCARQNADGGYKQITEDWGSAAYWQKEIQDIRDQSERILSQSEI